MTFETPQKLCDRLGFQATYEVITVGSCEQGDAEERGWLGWLGDAVDQPCDSHWDLQDLKRLEGYRWEGDGSVIPRWVTADADITDLIHRARPWGFLADADALSDSEVIGGSISIHRPDWITDASWLRVLRILGWTWRY